MASNKEDDSNIQHNSIPHNQPEESSKFIETKDSCIILENDIVSEPGMESLPITSHDQEEASSRSSESDIKQQPTGSFLLTNETKNCTNLAGTCEPTEADVEAKLKNSGSCPIQGRKNNEFKHGSKSNMESIVAVKRPSADDGSDRSLKSGETESAELISETELLKTAHKSLEISEVLSRTESNGLPSLADKTKDHIVYDKFAMSNLIVTENLCNDSEHVADINAQICSLDIENLKNSAALNLDFSNPVMLPETTTDNFSRTLGILRRRSASVEQLEKETVQINNDSIRFRKKRSFSEVCAPPKYKVHFTQMIDAKHDANEQFHESALNQENENQNSATLRTIAVSKLAGQGTNEKSDAETMRPPRNRNQSLDSSLAETSEKSSIDIYALEELSSTGTLPSKIAESTGSIGRNIMQEKRLPSKKRKESHDLFAQLHQHRKGSYDLSVSFGEHQNNLQRTHSKGFDGNFIKIRKGSHDLSVTFEDVRRARADSTSSLIVDVLLSPRKNSSDANSSANMTALGDPADYTIEVMADFDEHDEDNSLHHTSHLDISGLDELDTDRKPRHISKNNARTAGFPPTSDNDDGCGSDGTLGILRPPSSSMQTIGSAASASVPDSYKLSYSLPHTNVDKSITAAASLSARRDRLESWGAMSDLSIPYAADSALMVNLLGAWQQSDGANVDQSPSIETGSYPPRMLMGIRSRLNSIGSLSDGSIGETLPPLAPTSNHGDVIVDVGVQVEECVVAAMASVEDDIAALANALESAADFCFDFDDNSQTYLLGSHVPDGIFSDTSSTNRNGKRPRSWSTSSAMMSVDIEAVQAAVEAADAAKESLGLVTSSVIQQTDSSTTKLTKTNRRKLPLKRNIDDDDSQKVTGRKRVRSRQLVVAKVESSMATPAPTEAKSVMAPKKQKKPSTATSKRRGKTDTVEPTRVVSLDVDATPKIQNKRNVHSDDGSFDEMDGPTSNSKASKQKANQIGQSNQKWDSMLECLIEYANLRRAEETTSLSEKDRETWVWDGNVPTNYKSLDGKALGRWVNNQRSAKSKGSLKEDREQRLIDAGLKWSVMASNSWNLMLNELSIYINEQTRKGLTWDGNVPTNYQIKTKLESEFAGEDKNLGRWVNRQRSMYQAGKLRKERQLELEKIGLKWSMLATTSWDSMFNTLERHVQNQSNETTAWDGNVPANFKTDDNPPRSLGRWVNRQRSAFIKRKLKKEYVDKLNAIGLKWSVHQRHGENCIDECDEFDSDKDDDILDGEEINGDMDVRKYEGDVSNSQNAHEAKDTTVVGQNASLCYSEDVKASAEKTETHMKVDGSAKTCMSSPTAVEPEISNSMTVMESTHSDSNEVIAAIVVKAIIDGESTEEKPEANKSLEMQTDFALIETAMV